MIARRSILALISRVGTAMLSGCGLFGGGNEYRYKLTVELETPEGLRTGFAVRQVNWSAGRSVTQEASTASMSHKGEAVMVDLPNGETLFALMSPDGQETPMLAFGSAAQTSGSDRSVKVLRPPATPQTAYVGGGSGYPWFVRFKDTDDPKTLQKDDPANLAVSFGSGYRLKRVTAQIVDEPVTERVMGKLAWLERYKNDSIRLSGNSWPISVSDYLPEQIGTSAFSMGQLK